MKMYEREQCDQSVMPEHLGDAQFEMWCWPDFVGINMWFIVSVEDDDNVKLTFADCWAACQAYSGCNAASYEADSWACHLQAIPEDRTRISGALWTCRRQCEPGEATSTLS
jgi:hypothetical protein